MTDLTAGSLETLCNFVLMSYLDICSPIRSCQIGKLHEFEQGAQWVTKSQNSFVSQQHLLRILIKQDSIVVLCCTLSAFPKSLVMSVGSPGRRLSVPNEPRGRRGDDWPPARGKHPQVRTEINQFSGNKLGTYKLGIHIFWSVVVASEGINKYITNKIAG